jgi:hypothetical protein
VPAERRCGSCPVVWQERSHPTVPEAPPRVDPYRAPPRAERCGVQPPGEGPARPCRIGPDPRRRVARGATKGDANEGRSDQVSRPRQTSLRDSRAGSHAQDRVCADKVLTAEVKHPALPILRAATSELRAPCPSARVQSRLVPCCRWGRSNRTKTSPAGIQRRILKLGGPRAKGQRRQYVSGTRWWPPFCAAVDWVVAATIAVEIVARIHFRS